MFKLRYYTIYAIIWVLFLPPFWFLYLISDLLYFIIYYIIGYRKNAVLDNLRNAFPEKSNEELINIAKKFYKHLCDVIIETLKAINLSKSAFNRRYRIVNKELLDKYYNEKKDLIVLLAHYGNWEWIASLQTNINHQMLVIYQPLQNKVFDKLINHIRSRHGINLVAMNEVYKKLLDYVNNEKRVTSWFIGDLRPHKNTNFWIDFFNREVPFHVGAEKFAKKLNQDVVYMEVNILKRGFYELEFKVLAENSADAKEHEITTKFVRILEDNIKQNPEYWMWSHKRWKKRR